MHLSALRRSKLLQLGAWFTSDFTLSSMIFSSVGLSPSLSLPYSLIDGIRALATEEA